MIEQHRQRTKWLKPVGVLLVLVGVVVLLNRTVFRPHPVPVTVRHVETGRVENTVVNSRAGTVQSRRRSEMSPGLANLVVAIPARKGAHVKQGDVLLRLDDREYVAQTNLAAASLEAARADVEQARLAADQAARDWKRTQDLARSQVVSETVSEQAQTQALTTRAAVLAAEARVHQAEASLEVARATLAKTVIKAPFDGVVLDVTTEVGEFISPSPPGVPIPPVLNLIDPGALYVSAPIDEADVARLRVSLPVRITLDAFRGRSFAGTLTYVSSFVETRQDQNRTLRVEAEFEERSLPMNLLPGLSADIEVILEARDNVLRIPTYALLENNQVLVFEAGRLVGRKVTTGLHNWSFTEITAGLSPGDLVVVSLDRPEVHAGVRARITGEAEK